MHCVELRRKTMKKLRSWILMGGVLAPHVLYPEFRGRFYRALYKPRPPSPCHLNDEVLLPPNTKMRSEKSCTLADRLTYMHTCDSAPICRQSAAGSHTVQGLSSPYWDCNRPRLPFLVRCNER
eukprot:1160019-Pelagomonas_calceolata.AAC.3